MNQTEKEFIDLLHHHLGKIASTIIDLDMGGIDYKTIYEGVNSEFWEIGLKIEFLEGDVDLNKIQEAYTQDAKIQKLLSPDGFTHIVSDRKKNEEE